MENKMSSVIAPIGNVATEDVLRKILDPVDIIDGFVYIS